MVLPPSALQKVLLQVKTHLLWSIWVAASKLSCCRFSSVFRACLPCLPPRLPPRCPPPCALLALPDSGDPRPPPVLEPPFPARGAGPGLAQGLRWLNLYTVSMYCLSFRDLHSIMQKSGKPADLGSSAPTASGQLSE